MKKKNINIAVIGAGGMGRTHSYSIANLKFFYADLPFTATLHTICARKKEVVEAMRDNYGFLYAETDFNKVLNNPDIDIIDICTPNSCHYEMIMKAIKAKKNVLCEKPLVSNKEEADKLRGELNDINVTHGIVFNNRHIPATIRASQLVSEGRIGKILSFRCTYFHSSLINSGRKAGWRDDKALSGGGVLLDLGSHIIDLLNFIAGTGNEIELVTGKATVAFGKRPDGNGGEYHTDVDEAFCMMAKLKSGAVGTIEASKISLGSNDELAIEIYGDKGALKFSLMDPNFLYFYDSSKKSSPYGGESGFTRIECVQRYEYPAGTFPSIKAPIGWLRGHVHSMYHFINSVYLKKAASPSFYDGLYVNDVMDAAYKSDKSGMWEKV